MVGVHVGELTVDQHHDLVLALGLLLPDVGRDDPLGLLLQSRIPVHLRRETFSYKNNCEKINKSASLQLKSTELFCMWCNVAVLFIELSGKLIIFQYKMKTK